MKIRQIEMLPLQQTGRKNNLMKLQHTSEENREIRKLKKAAQDFESIFVKQLLKDMRQSISSSGLFGDGFSSDMYQSMFDDAIAEAVSGKGGFQLSDMLVKSLQRSSVERGAETGLTLKDYQLRPIKVIPANLSQFWDRSIIEQAAKKFNLQPKLVEAVIRVESNYNPRAISRKGAAGLMQLMPATATEMGVQDRFDPRQNVFGGAKYLRLMIDRFDHLEHAIAAYNAGPAAVQKYHGIPPYEETQDYVRKVLDYLRTK